MEGIRRRKRKMTREKLGEGTNHERLCTVGNNPWVLEGRKWVSG